MKKSKAKAMRPVTAGVSGMINSMKKHGAERGKQEFYKSKGKVAPAMKAMC